MMIRLTRNPMLVLAAAVLSSSFALSQQAPPPAATAPTAPAAPVVRQPPGNPGMRQGMRPGMMQRPMRPGMQGNFRGNMHSGFHGNMRGEEGGMGGPGSHIAPAGMWWKNPMVVQRLTLTPEQTRKMDDIFQQSRLQLIDLKAGVQKQEVMLEPLLSANPLDTLKAQAQIDKVADARAALEKANAHMLLGIRGVLTPDQWTKLHSRGAGEPGGGQTGAPAAAPGGPGGRSRGMRPGGSGSSTNLIDPIDVP